MWRAEDTLMSLFCKALFQEREEFPEPCSLNIVTLVRGEHLKWPEELL